MAAVSAGQASFSNSRNNVKTKFYFQNGLLMIQVVTAFENRNQRLKS